MKSVNIKYIVIGLLLLAVGLIALLTFNKSQKDLDSYTVGYKTNDGKGTRTEIVKRIGDFYCSVSHYYDPKTKENQLSFSSCSKIGGPIIMSSSDAIDCVLVLNTGVPRELDINLDSCFEAKENIMRAVYKKFELKPADKVSINFLKSDGANMVFKIGVSINCKDNPMEDSKIYDENIGCAGAEFAVQKKTGEWILIGGNDECKEEKYICDKIESLIRQK